MIELLVDQLKNTELEPTSEEIADVLWLAAQIRRRSQPAKPSPDTSSLPEVVSITDAASAADTASVADAASIPLTSSESHTPHTPFQEPRPIQLEYGAPLNPSQISTDVSDWENLGVPLFDDAQPALSALSIARALRPLLRRVPSRQVVVLDEEATAQRVADESIWLPVLRPAPERWLDIAFLVDEAPSMDIWEHKISSLQTLLGHHGAFRAVHRFSFDSGGPDAPILYVRTGKRWRERRIVDPTAVLSPTGRRLIVIVTDCVCHSWYTRRIYECISVWARHHPTVIFQMLDPWLWDGSALAEAVPVNLRYPYPGTPNAFLKVVSPEFWTGELPDGIPMPVVSLEPDSLGPWAQSLAGMGGIQIHGFQLPSPETIDKNQHDKRSLGTVHVTRHRKPLQRFREFREQASPSARRLASYLAASPCLNLPLMRFVQQAMMPESSDSHLAEVFLGGVL